MVAYFQRTEVEFEGLSDTEPLELIGNWSPMRRTYLEDLEVAVATRISNYDRYLRSVHDENRRRLRRSAGRPALLSIDRPQLWDAHHGYDPFHVRRRVNSVAHSVVSKIRAGAYEPRPPLGFEVPKPSGGFRLVSAFQIADEVVSRRLLVALSAKNESRLSARAYGYRPRLSVHDAIAHVSSEFRRSPRLFVAEFDFSKFFDRVEHDSVRDSLTKLGIVMTRSERELIERFLAAPEPSLVGQPLRLEPRKVGLPQGTSISLFLANVVASELDRALERIGVGFARYADDTLIWSDDYRRVTDAVAALYESSERIGAPINTAKSPGVRLLVPPATEEAEMRKTYAVDFLGHTVSLRAVDMKKSAVRRIQIRISDLLYNNLLREPFSGNQAPSRLTETDRDYATFVWQLRRYMYGPLSEADVRRYQAGRIPPMSFKGIMSFFPLVDHPDSLRILDEWLSTEVWLAMRKRRSLLSGLGLPTPKPHGADKATLLGWRSTSASTGEPVDLRLPSFQRMAGVVRSAVNTYGLGVVSGSGVSDYHYGEPAEA